MYVVDMVKGFVLMDRLKNANKRGYALGAGRDVSAYHMFYNGLCRRNQQPESIAGNSNSRMHSLFGSL